MAIQFNEIFFIIDQLHKRTVIVCYSQFQLTVSVTYVCRKVYCVIAALATGCPHALDVPYVWGYPMLQLNRDVRNQSGVIDGIGYTSVDIAYSDFWMTLITNFAKTGSV